MAKRTKWIDKVVEVFMEELSDSDQEPTERDEIKLQDKILTLIQFRANGLDHRRMGLLAADIYRLTHNTRARIIVDVAKVAVSVERKKA